MDVEFLFQTVQRQLEEMRKEAQERHRENQLRLDRIDDRLASLEKWRAVLVGAWGTIIAFVTIIWALAREWRPWSRG